jgi:hypothetical protein
VRKVEKPRKRAADDRDLAHPAFFVEPEPVGTGDRAAVDAAFPEEGMRRAGLKLVYDAKVLERLEQARVEVGEHLASLERRRGHRRVQHGVGRERIDERVDVTRGYRGGKGVVPGDGGLGGGHRGLL